MSSRSPTPRPDRRLTMCRNITTLRGLEPAATPEEIEAGARQYVRKISGVQKTSAATEEAFERRRRGDHRDHRPDCSPSFHPASNPRPPNPHSAASPARKRQRTCGRSERPQHDIGGRRGKRQRRAGARPTSTRRPPTFGEAEQLGIEGVLAGGVVGEVLAPARRPRPASTSIVCTPSSIVIRLIEQPWQPPPIVR